MHDTTGFSPFHLMYGREVRVPLQLAKEQWEVSEQLPVSVAEYLSNLYDWLYSMDEGQSKRKVQGATL